MEFIMKRLITAVALVVLSVPAMAQHYHGPHGVPFVRTGADWVGPALIGGMIGYALSQPRTVYVQPPVIYAPPPVIYAPAPVIVQQQQWCEHRAIVDQYGIHRTAQVCWYQ
jgi:hypothetical protein